LDAQAVFRKRDRRLLFAVSPEDRPENWHPSPTGFGWLGVRHRPDELIVVCVSRIGGHLFCRVLEMDCGGVHAVGDHRHLPEEFRVAPLDRWAAGCEAGSSLPDLRARYDGWQQELARRERARAEAVARDRREAREREEHRQRVRAARELRVAQPRPPLNQSDDIFVQHLRDALEEARACMTRLQPGRRQRVTAVTPAGPLAVFQRYLREHGVREVAEEPQTVEEVPHT